MPPITDPAVLDRILRSLTKTPMFSRASRYDLLRLLAGAELKKATPGQVICEVAVPYDPNGPAATSYFLPVDGRFQFNGQTVHHGLRHGVVGLKDVLYERPRTITLKAKTVGEYLEFQGADFHSLLASSTPFRQAVKWMLDLDDVAPVVPPALGTSGGRGNVVQCITTIPDLPLALLVDLLGRSIASHFSDKVVIVEPCAPGEPPSTTPIAGPGPGWLFRAKVDSPDLSAFVDMYDYVLVDGLSPPQIDTIAKLAFECGPELLTPPPIGEPRVLHTTVIGMPALPCGKELHFVDANPMKTTTANACRVRLDIGKLIALAGTWNRFMPITPIDPKIEREMAVWARALTQRRTGIALAGGGVWSMQSVTILRELAKKKVPVDIITGTSAGAMIGAYYSAFGLEGLDRIVELGDSGALDALTLLWMVSGCFVELFFDCEFGAHTCLCGLDVEFRPNSTNLTDGDGVAITRGPLSLAIRAAASAPPLFPPAFSGDTRFVDGAFSNNVAAQVLPYFGADLTFAANTYPPSRRVSPPWMPSILTRIASLGLLSRTVDFTVALNLLASLTGKIEGEFANVSFNADTVFPAPFLLTSNFCLSSKVVQHAEQDAALHAAVDEFAEEWESLKLRGSVACATY